MLGLKTWPTELLIAIVLLGAVGMPLWGGWRGRLMALLLQYLGVGFLLDTLLSPEVGLAHILAGGLAGVVLYLGARRCQTDQIVTRLLMPGTAFDLAFRAVAVTIVALVVWTGHRLAPWPWLPAPMGLVVYSLAGASLLTLGLAPPTIEAGIALLALWNAFELAYARLASGPAWLGLISLIGLPWALAISYLAYPPAGRLEEGD